MRGLGVIVLLMAMAAADSGADNALDDDASAVDTSGNYTISTALAGDYPCSFVCSSGTGISCGGAYICCTGGSGHVGCVSNVLTCSCPMESMYLSYKYGFSDYDYGALNYGGQTPTMSIPRNERLKFAFFLNPQYRYVVSYTRSNSNDPLASVASYICDEQVEDNYSCTGRGDLGTVTSFSLCPGNSCTQRFECDDYQELKLYLDNNNGFFQGKLDVRITVSRSLVTGDPCERDTPTVKPTTTVKPTSTIFPTHHYTPRPTYVSSPGLEESSGMEDWAFWLLIVAGVVFAAVFVITAAHFIRKAQTKKESNEATALLSTSYTADQAAAAPSDPSHPSEPSQSLSV